jgi:cytochrome c oxidase assembly protein subunit 15
MTIDASIKTPASLRPHRLATLLVCVVFPLIWVGGLVTSTEAGMAVPDWPNTYGYNLFLYPLSTWLAGPWDIFVEHGHRLLGAAAGFISIALAWSLWRNDERRWMRWLGIAALAAVIGQGVLGGLRVVLDARLLAMTHACTGPLYFVLCVAIWQFTRERPKCAIGFASASSNADRGTGEASGRQTSDKIFRLALLTTCLAYLQLVLGAIVRHMPVYAPPSTFKAAVHFHLFMAAVLTVHVVLLVGACLRAGFMKRGAWFLAALIVAQLALGFGTWVVNFGYPQWVGQLVTTPDFVIRSHSLPQVLITTAHVALGSLIIVTSLVATLRARRPATSHVSNMASGATSLASAFLMREAVS